MSTRSRHAVVPVALLTLALGCHSSVAPQAQVISAGNAAQLRRIATLGAPGSVLGFLAFSPADGSVIAGDRTGEVFAWESGTWNRTRLLPPFTTPQAADSANIPFYPSAALSPDGRTIAAATSAVGDMVVRTVGGVVLSTLSYGSPVYSVDISPDGRLVAVGGLDGNVIVRELANGTQVADLRCDRQYVSVLAFSPDGRTLVVGYERPGNLMKAWSTSTWQETATFSQMAERVDFHDAEFTPDGRYLVLARVGLSEPAVIEMLDASTYQVVRRISDQVSAFQLAFSPDGLLLASSWSGLDLWESATGNAVRAIGAANHSFSVTFSPDGTLLALGVDGEGVQLWGVPR